MLALHRASSLQYLALLVWSDHFGGSGACLVAILALILLFRVCVLLVSDLWHVRLFYLGYLAIASIPISQPIGCACLRRCVSL